MKELFIKQINPSKKVTLKEAGHILEAKTVTNQIDTLNWPGFSYKPKLNFRIGHTGTEIWLKYYVSEKYILAQKPVQMVMFTKTAALSFSFPLMERVIIILNLTVLAQFIWHTARDVEPVSLLILK